MTPAHRRTGDMRPYVKLTIYMPLKDGKAITDVQFEPQVLQITSLVADRCRGRAARMHPQGNQWSPHWMQLRDWEQIDADGIEFEATYERPTIKRITRRTLIVRKPIKTAKLALPAAAS